MAAYIIVQIDVRDSEMYEQYKALAPASIAAYGGRYLVRGGAVETLEGGWHPSRFVILEFPSAARARSWWSSPEYAAARTVRQSAARSEMILVEGVPPDLAA